MPKQWMRLCVTESCSWRYFVVYLFVEYDPKWPSRRGLDAGVSQLTANEVIRCSALVIIIYYSFFFYSFALYYSLFNTCARRVTAAADG